MKFSISEIEITLKDEWRVLPIHSLLNLWVTSQSPLYFASIKWWIAFAQSFSVFFSCDDEMRRCRFLEIPIHIAFAALIADFYHTLRLFSLAWELQQMHLLMKMFYYSFSTLICVNLREWRMFGTVRWKWKIPSNCQHWVLRLMLPEKSEWVNQYLCFLKTTTTEDNVGCSEKFRFGIWNVAQGDPLKSHRDWALNRKLCSSNPYLLIHHIFVVIKD